MPIQEHEASITVRPAHAGDDPGIAAVARGNAQPEQQSGVDSEYTSHLRQRGTLLVAHVGNDLVGYGATVSVGAASLLADLFVDPAHHGAGVGRALLGALWPAGPSAQARFTFASQDPRAMSLYVRAGLTPWWPLLTCKAGQSEPPESALDATRVQSAVAARAEAGLTGVDRAADLAFLSGDGLVISRDGRVITAGILTPASLTHTWSVRRRQCSRGSRLRPAPARRNAETSVCLPGPHPA